LLILFLPFLWFLLIIAAWGTWCASVRRYFSSHMYRTKQSGQVWNQPLRTWQGTSPRLEDAISIAVCAERSGTYGSGVCG
jgi:hypothetical protein